MCTLNQTLINNKDCNSTTCIIYWHKYLHYWTSKDFDEIRELTYSNSKYDNKGHGKKKINNNLFSSSRITRSRTQFINIQSTLTGQN
uniref:CSON000925 protein n=1 Tax=Culicoides sonorensis TaxID=179676 RepID=A0A336KX38_CULSO